MICIRSGANLILRQENVNESIEDFTVSCIALNGQMVIPMCHYASNQETKDMNAFTENVNKLFISKNEAMRMFNPERLKWYTINTGIYSID